MPLNASALEVGSPGFQTLIQTNRQFIAGIFGDGNMVLRQGHFDVTANATSHAVDVAAGKAILSGANTQDQGSYFAWSESSETIAWPAPSANPRIDSLILRVADPQYGTVTGQVGARWDIIQGVPLATPAARSDTEINTTFFVPGAWMRVADIRVNAADTGAIPSGQVTKKTIPYRTSVVEHINMDAGSLQAIAATPNLTDAATTAQTSFVAPRSGKVMLTFSAIQYVNANSGTLTNYVFTRPYIQGGQYPSMTDLGETYQTLFRFSGSTAYPTNQSNHVTKRRMITGLQAGVTYTIQLWYWLNSTGPTIGMDDRVIVIEPVIE